MLQLAALWKKAFMQRIDLPASVKDKTMSESGTMSSGKSCYTGAELIFHLLEKHGITIVSGIPGGAPYPFMTL